MAQPHVKRAAPSNVFGRERKGNARVSESAQASTAGLRERLSGLDLLRGIAALAVLTLHLPWPSDFPSPLPRGYLAVDLFFVLSGFVIAHAYHHRLRTHSQLKQFCIARLIRLYPLYCAATLLSAALMVAYLLFGSGRTTSVTTGSTAASIATALLFLPTPPGWSVEPVTFFPLVFAAWSLFWELWVNFLYAITINYLRPLLLAVVIAVGACGIGLGIYYHSSAALGVNWLGAWGGGARALFSFFVGVAVFRFRRRQRAPQVSALLLAGVLVFALTPQSFGGWAYDLVCIICLFPVLVWLGADALMKPRVSRAGEFLGFLSYPIYLLQAPFLLAFGPVSARLSPLLPMYTLLQPLLYAVLVILGSWLVARRFDSPARERLRRHFAPGSPKPPAQTAP